MSRILAVYIPPLIRNESRIFVSYTVVHLENVCVCVERAIQIIRDFDQF
jgi:hypothetical protein